MTVTELHTPPATDDGPLVELDAWVAEWFGSIVERRRSNTARWCVRWYEHPEVVARMWLLFHGHRQVVAHGSALDQSSWLLDHLDRHVDRLMAPDGPFSACSPQRHSTIRHLPLEQGVTP